MEPTWYERFFQGVALDLWRKAADRDLTVAEADFLERTFQLPAGARILDVPCGMGRIALELATRGFTLTGVDLSAESIAEARELSAGAGLAIEWRHGDMRDLPWPGEFDAAFCFGNSFGYLEPAGNRDFLHAAARCLKPGGRFALETGNLAESVLPRLKHQEWARVDDIWFLEENRYLPEQSCMQTTYTFIRKGEATTRTGLHWVYTAREFRGLVEEAGFGVEGWYGSLNGDRFDVGTPQLILVARKT